MNGAEVQRFARQIALPEVGPDGQTRIGAARVLVTGGGLVAETAASYLTAAGIGQVISREIPPADGYAWLEALAEIDLVVRASFDDDAMLGAAKRLGLPVIVARATPVQVDVISFARRAPIPPLPPHTTPPHRSPVPFSLRVSCRPKPPPRINPPPPPHPSPLFGSGR